jgi:copper(I)-binding protein
MSKLSRGLAAAAMLLALAHAGAHEYTAGSLKIGHPWSRMTVTGQVAGAGYLKIENTGAAADRLVGASSPASDHEELHNMALDGTVMRMREVSAIELPAGQTVALEPGHMHLMLVGLKEPLKPGTRVPLTLKFEKAGAVPVELMVEAPKMADPASAGASHQH